MAHRKDPKKLFCMLTRKHLNKIYTEVKLHLEGRAYKNALKAHQEQEMKKLGGGGGDGGSGSEGEGDDIDEEDEANFQELFGRPLGVVIDDGDDGDVIDDDVIDDDGDEDDGDDGDDPVELEEEGIDGEGSDDDEPDVGEDDDGDNQRPSRLVRFIDQLDEGTPVYRSAAILSHGPPVPKNKRRKKH